MLELVGAIACNEAGLLARDIFGIVLAVPCTGLNGGDVSEGRLGYCSYNLRERERERALLSVTT